MSALDTVGHQPTTPKSTNVRSPGWVRLGMGVVGALAPPAAAWIAEQLFFTPRRHRRPAREGAWLRGAQRLGFRVDGRRLAAWSWGAGPAVLLVHGWEGRGSQLGAFAEPLVRAGFRAVALDAPAHGASAGRTAHPIVFADAIVAVADRVGPLEAVIAHSMGALATSIAVRDRALAARQLVYVAPSGPPSMAHAHVSAALGLAPPIADRFRRRMEARVGRPLEEFSFPRLAARMQLPLHILHDLDDSELPADVARELAALWPAAELTLTRGLGHRRILRDPGVVEQVVGRVQAGPRAVGPRDPWQEFLHQDFPVEIAWP